LNADLVRHTQGEHDGSVIAVQQADHPAGSNSDGLQPACQCVGVLVEFTEGDRAVFVGNGRRIAITRCGVGGETAESAVAAHRYKCAQCLVRANWVDHAAAG
jgi:hypothetical protein